MRTSERGRLFIQQFEGFEPKKYLCIAGKPTIGYGHVIKPKEMAELGNAVLTEKDADNLLKDDLERYENAVDMYIDVLLTQSQYDALVSFCYNLGTNALKISTLRGKLNKGDYASVPYQLSRWNKITKNGKKVAVAGLTRRRKAEGDLFSS